jgi:DNA-binding Lrp family transcriptional regulator
MIEAYILVQTQVGKPTLVAHEISKLPGVVSSDSVTGPYDVVVRAEGRSLDDLARRVVQAIQEIDGVTRTLTCPIIRL